MAQVPCTRCGVLITSITATDLEGLCVPCSRGGRGLSPEDIERAYSERREEERRRAEDPYWRLWLRLAEKLDGEVHHAARFTAAELTYFAVNELDREIYNGGFEQYFTNSGGNRYAEAVRGLEELGAVRSAQLARRAKDLIFGDRSVPTDWFVRQDLVRVLSPDEPPPELDNIAHRYCDDPDGLEPRLQAFARRMRLVP